MKHLNFKCYGFNHKAENCNNGEYCFKCGATEHKAADSIELTHKCVNCLRTKINLGIEDLNVEHDSRSTKCPIYLRKLNNERKKDIILAIKEY